MGAGLLGRRSTSSNTACTKPVLLANDKGVRGLLVADVPEPWHRCRCEQQHVCCAATSAFSFSLRHFQNEAILHSGTLRACCKLTIMLHESGVMQ